MPYDSATLIQNAEKVAALGRITPENLKPTSASMPPEAIELKKQLEMTLRGELNRNEVALTVGPDGLIISLREVGFFDSGSASMRPPAKVAFGRIANILGHGTYKLRIEGHTDDRPIHTDKFASNWELSTARATEVVRLLVTEYQLGPERLSAAGFAEFHPVANNATARGREVNRRVDVVVLNRHGKMQIVDEAAKVRFTEPGGKR